MNLKWLHTPECKVQKENAKTNNEMLTLPSANPLMTFPRVSWLLLIALPSVCL